MGGVGRSSSFAVSGIEVFEIKLGDDIDDEACQMGLWQAIAESNVGVDGGLVVEGFE